MIMFDCENKNEDCRIIMKCSSGIHWSNQSGGHACRHPKEEGVLIDTPIYEDELEFFYSEHGGYCSDGITEEDANRVDKILKEHSVIYHSNNVFKDNRFALTVDRTRLKDSMEAWVYINIGDKKGVLVWGNSD